MRTQARFSPRLLILFFLSMASVFSAVAAEEAERFAVPESDEGLPGEGPIRREDWFRNLWQSKRADWSRSVERDQGAVVFLGDSITQGWGPGLGAVFPELKVANRGISGDTTRGVLIRLEEDVLALDPSAVVLLIGTNDLGMGAEPETIAGNMKLILAALKEHDPAMPVVLCEVFPSSASRDRPSEKIREINDRYLDLVKGDAQITYLDTFDLFDDGAGDALPEEFPDLLHPNEAGYAKWAAALRPVFATFGLREREPDFELEEGFVYLFNGHDLTGWGYRPSTQADREQAQAWQKRDPQGAARWPFLEKAENFDGLKRTPDGRFAAINGRLVVTTTPERRLIQQLYTQKEFPKDFVLKMEFRATPNADSGVYVRGPQLQCRDYALAGPYRDLKRYKPQDWNELVITVKDGKARGECNGEVLEEGLAVPPTGPIGIEGDRGQMEYRRIRLMEL